MCTLAAGLRHSHGVLNHKFNLHAPDSAQEITTHEDLNEKFYNINLSTPHQITADNFNNSLVRIKKKITFKSFDYVGIKLKK